jgi:hypothetical protein
MKICASVWDATTPACLTRAALPALPHSAETRRNNSLQKCWAALIASLVFLIPANMLPISIIYVNGAVRRILSSGLSPWPQQRWGGGDRLYRQYPGSLYQSGGDVYPAHQHSL